jgi:hypothetical protein
VIIAVGFSEARSLPLSYYPALLYIIFFCFFIFLFIYFPFLPRHGTDVVVPDTTTFLSIPVHSNGATGDGRGEIRENLVNDLVNAFPVEEMVIDDLKSSKTGHREVA